MSSGKHVPKPHIYLQMYRHLRHRAGIFHENECCLNRCPLCGHWSSVTAVQSSLCMAGYQQPDSSHKNGSWVEDFLQFQAAISSARGLHQLALWGIVTWEQQHLELTKWFKKCTHTCTHACMHARTHTRTHTHIEWSAWRVDGKKLTGSDDRLMIKKIVLAGNPCNVCWCLVMKSPWTQCLFSVSLLVQGMDQNAYSLFHSVLVQGMDQNAYSLFHSVLVQGMEQNAYSLFYS